MSTPSKKSFDSPDDHVRFPGISADVVEVGDASIVRTVFEPGMHCAQISMEGKPRCLAHHAGVILGGRLHIEMDDGSALEVGPNDVYDIPPGHDGWAVGDEAMHTISWAGYHSWMPERAGERVLVTLLVTDIVDSTRHAAAVGDSQWRRTLADHNRQVRAVLDRFRGREITTTGDGFLAVFDGAARAVRAGLAIVEEAGRLDLAVRAGIHSGEVEFAGADIRGLAVNEVTRVAAAAGGGEVLVSATTQALAGGAGLAFVERGAFELKGLPGRRTLFSAAAA